MYSKDLEEAIDLALILGYLTDGSRNMLRLRAKAEGENADEVIKYAEKKLEQQKNNAVDTSFDKEAFHNDLLNDILNSEKEREFYISRGDSQPTHSQTQDATKIVKPKVNKSMAVKSPEARTRQLTVPMNAISKVCKLIDGYNKKASKWGYELLTLNSDNTISGKFTPKNNGSGFFAGIKEAYKNGDLEEEWNKILILCGVV
jgi:hypothetical protein